MATAVTCVTPLALPVVITGTRPLLAAPVVSDGAMSPNSTEPGVISVRREGDPARKSCRRVSFQDLDVAELFTFKPAEEGRIDVDLDAWLLFAGTPSAPVSQTVKPVSSEWKMDR